VLPSKYTEEFKEFASSQLDTLEADVFYVYPTLNTDKEDIRWNAPIDDLEQNDKVLNKAGFIPSLSISTYRKSICSILSSSSYSFF
jgi:hypothetical protein